MESSLTGIIVLVFRIIIALFLVGFLAYALRSMWKDFSNQSTIVRTRLIPPISLLSTQESELLPQTYSKPQVIIGRDPGCDYRIPNETVSGIHARLTYHHNQWWVEDNQSTNGTYLNDERIITPIVLISKDEIRCGTISLSVEIGQVVRAE
jgi:pSer/pThr/pTyr-binding forkhead associated (FHA) protein